MILKEWVGVNRLFAMSPQMGSKATQLFKVCLLVHAMCTNLLAKFRQWQLVFQLYNNSALWAMNIDIEQGDAFVNFMTKET